MASSKSLAFSLSFLSFNLLFFTLVSSTYVPCPPPPKSHKSHPKKPPTIVPSPPAATTKPPTTIPTPPAASTKPPTTPAADTCPKDTLKLGVCAKLLNDLVNLVVATPPKTPCCTLIGGLTDLEAAVCLCTAIKANVLGININVPVSLSVLLNYCGKQVPSGFKCA